MTEERLKKLRKEIIDFFLEQIVFHKEQENKYLLDIFKIISLTDDENEKRELIAYVDRKLEYIFKKD